MYATPRYNFVGLKATHKISPLEELVGGDLPPSNSQRLTGMNKQFRTCANTFPNEFTVAFKPTILYLGVAYM
jgi:hypothetical protein